MIYICFNQTSLKYIRIYTTENIVVKILLRRLSIYVNESSNTINILSDLVSITVSFYLEGLRLFEHVFITLIVL